MDRLPDELLVQILAFLEPYDIVSAQAAARRFHSIARDNNLWKNICFDNSKAEAARRRQTLRERQDANLTALRDAIVASTSGDIIPREERDATRNDDRESVRVRGLANWDPTYHSERVDFYTEYIERHAPISLKFVEGIRKRDHADSVPLENTGVGIVESTGSQYQKLLSPLEDGSVCIYDLDSLADCGSDPVKLSFRSSPGLLFGDGSGASTPLLSLANETEATDNVTIDNAQGKGYIAVFNQLNEIDLSTLQVSRRQQFPFPITALSTAQHPIPLTIGTLSTLHLFDPRSNQPQSTIEHTARCELIAGMPSRASYSHTPVSLSEPGPLSILQSLNLSPNSIWVAGRFKFLLHYDRRAWPRIESTLFSGARLSCLSSIPHPYISRNLDLMRNTSATLAHLQAAKAAPGTTLLACGEYKGKGSLEIYGLAGSTGTHSSSPDQQYRNRQTAAKSRLLSVAPHGTRIVFSDGDGNMKWVERDGVGSVRTFNINDALPRTPPNDGQPTRIGGVFAPRADDDGGPSDLVRKIIPCNSAPSTRSTTSSVSTLPRNDLIVWTGEGRLGIVGFGSQRNFGLDGGVMHMHEAVASAEEKGEERLERLYGQRMREALERQADETRFVRGLGLGYDLDT